MTISRWLVIGAVAWTGAACGADTPVEPTPQERNPLSAASVQPPGGQDALSAASARSAGGAHPVRVPFKATAEGIGIEPDPAPVCDAGFFPAGNRAHGSGTHLGRFTSIHRQCVNPGTGEFRDGFVTFHAANGDQLHATFEGFLKPTGEDGVFSFENPAHPVGGTGRFDEADGRFRASGLVDLNDNTFEIEVEGFLVLSK